MARAKNPKDALSKWLKKHAAEFELLHKGKPNESAVKWIAKIANWQPEGGAPKTSGG